MPFVLDASVTASWAFRDEHHTVADAAQARLRADDAAAPDIWWFEVRNSLLMGERRGRLTEPTTDAFLRGLGALQISIDRSPDATEMFALARRHKLTIYDAAYLELAIRLAAPLATLDRKLAAAAIAESVPLIGTP